MGRRVFFFFNNSDIQVNFSALRLILRNYFHQLLAESHLILERRSMALVWLVTEKNLTLGLVKEEGILEFNLHFLHGCQRQIGAGENYYWV